MKPSIFLELAYPLDYYNSYPEGFEYIINHIDKDLPIATPYLIVMKLGNGDFQIEGHEGRHRTVVIKKKYGDIPSKVLLIFENFVAGDLIKTLNKINYGVISEDSDFVEGPLFKY